MQHAVTTCSTTPTTHTLVANTNYKKCVKRATLEDIWYFSHVVNNRLKHETNVAVMKQIFRLGDCWSSMLLFFRQVYFFEMTSRYRFNQWSWWSYNRCLSFLIFFDKRAFQTCTCTDGFTGKNCETAVPCFSNPCENRADCVNSLDYTGYRQGAIKTKKSGERDV